MSAKVSKKFERGFELTEEGLRRLHADIRNRIPEESHGNIKIEVYREDSLVYKTAEIDRILSESNDSTVKIKSITIEYMDHSIDINLTFDSVEGAEVTIKGEDRDRVFLIYSDLKEYIQKEVAFLRAGSFASKPATSLISLVAIMTIVGVLLFSSAPVQPADVNSIIESDNINEKINFLINDINRKGSTEGRMKYMFLMPIILAIGLIMPANQILRFLFPYNTFLIGKEIQIVGNRKSFTNNLIWVVGIGTAVSLITGYYFLWLAK